MSKLEELRDGLAYVAAELRNIHEAAEDRDLTDEEEARWAEGEQYVTATSTAIKKEEQRAAVLEAAEAHGHPADGARDFQYQRKVDTRVEDVARLSRQEARDRALAIVERDGSDLSGSQQKRVENLIRRSDGEIARRTLLTENDDYRSAWMKSMLHTSPAYTADEVRALDEFRAMGGVVDSAGGYGVPVLIDPSIILTDQETTNPFIAAGSTVKTITTDAWKGVSAAGVSWAFETEAAAANDISPTLAQPTISVHKAQGFIPYSIEIGMDYPEFSSEMSRLLGIGYEELLIENFTTGSGSTAPFGIITAIDATAGSEVAVGTDGALFAADVFSVWKDLPQKYRRNASWMMNVDVNNEIRSLGDDSLFQQTVNLAAGSADMLMGRPVYENPYFPEFTGTTGAANILIVGDFSNFYIIQRAGMNVELVPHVFDTTTGTPTGQRGWYAWARVGSDSVNDAAFRLLQNT